jgi:long-subunit acyl-CoA synthetase (AMP-forming)
VRLQSVLVAIVVPNEVTVKAWASTNGVAGATLHDWVGVEALQKAVEADVLRVGKEARVSH